MADYVLTGLTKRRAELTGEADTLQARLTQIDADLGHLDAVIRQFDPEYDFGSIRPKRSRGPDVTGRGEMSRFILGVLREAAEPVTTQEVARRLMTERGQDMKDQRLVAQTMKRVAMALSRQKTNGTVRSEQGPGSLCFGRWPANSYLLGISINYRSSLMPKRISKPAPRPWPVPLTRALQAALHIACHTFVALCLIGAIELIAYVLRQFGEPKLFDLISLRYCFDAMDACILLAFLVFGVVGAARWFRE